MPLQASSGLDTPSKALGFSQVPMDLSGVLSALAIHPQRLDRMLATIRVMLPGLA